MAIRHDLETDLIELEERIATMSMRLAQQLRTHQTLREAAGIDGGYQFIFKRSLDAAQQLVDQRTRLLKERTRLWLELVALKREE